MLFCNFLRTPRIADLRLFDCALSRKGKSTNKLVQNAKGTCWPEMDVYGTIKGTGIALIIFP